jgi:hypothetical protein
MAHESGEMRQGRTGCLSESVPASRKGRDGGLERDCAGTDGCHDDAAYLTMHQFARSDNSVVPVGDIMESSKYMSFEL